MFKNKKLLVITNSLIVFVLMLTIFTGMVMAKDKVKLTATFAAPKERWDWLVSKALPILKENHPELDIEFEYEVLPYSKTHDKLVTMMIANTPRDLVSVDGIWLGEFAQGGLLKDITEEVKAWGRMDEFYEVNRQGSKFDGKYYGVWAWTDARVLWYWPDLLEKADVEPEELTTWDGYLAAAKKLNKTLRPEGIEGVHLVGAPHSPDMFFPYLWMNGGKILEKRDGKWYPAFHKEPGIKALNFIKQQVETGIKPQKQHFWGQEFVDRRFAVMLEGSWLAGKFSKELSKEELENKIGMLPLFPTPGKGTETATMAGGWVLALPGTSKHQELAWELMQIILSPEIMSEFLAEYGYLPTQKVIAESAKYNKVLKENIPFFDKYTEILPLAHGRPNIPEYPQISEALRIAIEEVYYRDADPAVALNKAAEKVAEILGWSGLED